MSGSCEPASMALAHTAPALRKKEGPLLRDPSGGSGVGTQFEQIHLDFRSLYSWLTQSVPSPVV